MPQGNMKVKAKLPPNAKSKKKPVKGPAITKRPNCPVAPKKQKHQEAQKLKKMISKTVNDAMEDELRARALDGKRSLRKKGVTAGGSKPKK